MEIVDEFDECRDIRVCMLGGAVGIASVAVAMGCIYVRVCMHVCIYIYIYIYIYIHIYIDRWIDR